MDQTTAGGARIVAPHAARRHRRFGRSNVDIASAAAYQRDDITEGKTGVPLKLTSNIVNVINQMRADSDRDGLRVACDKDGYYSGYNQNGADLRGQTLLRGVQTTDTSGRAIFNTIYPGWYPGRATHIHFRVYLALDLQATSQLAFPDSVTSAVSSSSLYVAKGQNPETSLCPPRIGVSMRMSHNVGQIVGRSVRRGGLEFAAVRGTRVQARRGSTARRRRAL